MFDTFSLEKKESFNGCKIETKRISDDGGVFVGDDENDKVSPTSLKYMHSPMYCLSDEGVFVTSSDVEDEQMEQEAYKKQPFVETKTKTQTVMSKIDHPVANDYDIISDDEDMENCFIDFEMSDEHLQPKPIVLSNSLLSTENYYQLIENCIEEMDRIEDVSLDFNRNEVQANHGGTNYYQDTSDLIAILSSTSQSKNTTSVPPIKVTENLIKKYGK
jgi:hypothetical protein